jgi:molybdopterin synthase sulfur carrier subunit
MAKVTVRMYATVRDASGRPSCDMDASDLGGLLNGLRKRFGPKLAKVIGTREAWDDKVVILLNGVNIDRASGLSTKLKEGDEVSIFPPVSGG